MNINNYYELTGEGQTVVFIHGSFASSAAWRHYTKALSDHYQCLCIKLPGHNSPELSDEDAETFSNDAEFVEHIVTNLLTEPIKLVGHSYGAVICGELAMRGNIDISSLTLFDPVAVWTLSNIGNVQLDEIMQRFLTELTLNYEIAPESVCRQVLDFWNDEEIFDALPDRIKQQMLPAVAHNFAQWAWCRGITHDAQTLKEMRVPTTVVYGTRSNPIIHHISRFFANTMGQARLIEVKGANHFLINTHTSECLEVLNQDFSASGNAEETRALEQRIA